MKDSVKRLYRSKNNRTFLGILGGLGDYWEMDATLLRVIFVFLLLATGIFPFGIAYLIVYFIVPLESENG